jgi:hypothetical protein
MTDADENTPSEEHGRIAFQPDYDEYGLQPLDDGTLILRIDQDRHLFERVGAIRHEHSAIVLEQYVRAESLAGEGSFERIGSVSAEGDDFESRLRNGILHLIYEGKVPEDQAETLADDLAESVSEQFE